MLSGPVSGAVSSIRILANEQVKINGTLIDGEPIYYLLKKRNIYKPINYKLNEIMNE